MVYNLSYSQSPPELNKFDPRARPGQKNERAQQAYAHSRGRNRHSNANVHFVPLVPHSDATSAGARKMGDKTATFGQRRNVPKRAHTTTTAKVGKEGGFEMSWVPSSSGKDPVSRVSSRKDRKGIEVFGAGMERGDEEKSHALSESERSGRTQRRKGMRSGSKNVLRQFG